MSSNAVAVACIVIAWGVVALKAARPWFERKWRRR